MKPADREQWILDYLRRRSRPGMPPESVDVLHADFVDDFADATGCPLKVVFVGANICPQLGLDLSRMFKEGKLRRHIAGVQGLAGMGFPRWVYSYKLP